MMKVCLLMAALLTLSACTTLTKPSTIADSVGRPACHSALTALDNLALQYAGTLVGNRLSAMPWLRYDRLIRHDIQVQSDVGGMHKLLKRMAALAMTGLSDELAAVPEKQLQQWQSRHRISIAHHVLIKRCTGQLMKSQLRSPKITLARLKAIPVDNDYSTVARVAGLYPLAAVPFRRGVVREQKQLAKAWGQVSGKRWTRYQASLNTRPDRSLRSHRLLNRHAPTWLIDRATPANRPGAPYWQGGQLKVNTQQPTTYAFVSKARWQQQSITQLNYVVWFTERPRLKRLDWVAGQHDAVVFRVNLTDQGEVIAYDSIHLCGCWYRLFLPVGRPFVASNRYWAEPVLMQRLQVQGRSAPRMAVYLQSDTHQIQYVQPAVNVAKGDYELAANKTYQLRSFATLQTLPSDRGRRAVFNRQGYVSGSERPERWLFWPMGVRNPGALRRFGDHAISFIGRRYFDDPQLLEKVSGLVPRR